VTVVPARRSVGPARAAAAGAVKAGTPRRLALGLVAVLACGLLLGLVGHRLAAQAIRAEVVAALGPQSEVDAVLLRAGHVVLEGLRVKAPAGWPAPLALSARRVVVVPELRTLLSAHPRIARVELEDTYLSVLRTGDGRLRVLPGVLDRPAAPRAGARGAAAPPAARAVPPPAAPGAAGPASAAAPASAAPATAGSAGGGDRADSRTPAPPPEATAGRGRVSIGRIELRGGSLDHFDGSVRRTPHRIRIDALDATLTAVELPALDGRSTLRLTGRVKAAPRVPAARDGTLSIDGWLVVASRDSTLSARLRDVDLVALQPYLARAADTTVRAGTLDLDLDAAVAGGRLRAPGTLTLAGLSLASGGGFMGLPREAVLGLLEDRQGRIRIDFVLEGRLDDPRFSISEDLAVRAAAAVAESLGISLEGLVRGAGGVGRKGTDAALDAIRGLLGR
jgi:hypothetical protein